MRFNSGISCLSTLSNLVTRQFLNSPDPDIPELFETIEGANVLEDLGLGDLPRVNYTVSQWSPGRIPEACYDLVLEPDLLGGRCDAREVEVYEVTYDDCEQEPWIICRCQDADEDVERLFTDLGQLPVHARDYVRYVVMSDHQRIDGIYELEGSSVWWEGDLIIYGNWSSVGLFVHEVAHTMDYFVSGNEEIPYSETSAFERILDADTCVVDYYSKTTYSEAYAQAAVLLAFDLNRSGPLSDVVDHDCMSGVHEVMEEHLGDYLTYNSSATCRTPLRKGPNMCLNSGRFSRCSTQDDNGNDDNDDNDDNDGNDDNDDNDDNDVIDDNDDNGDNGGSGGNNDNDDDDNGGSGGNNNNDDDDDSDAGSGSNSNDDDESAAVRLSMGSMPMAVFWGVGQVFRAVGLMNGQ